MVFFEMSQVRFTNTSMCDILCFKPLFIIEIIESLFKNIFLDDKTCNANLIYERTYHEKHSHTFLSECRGFFVNG